MKVKFFTTMFLLTFISLSAQVPEKAEDISPLLIGEELPEINVINPNGSEVSLQKILKIKPTVVVFYRGGWCPYCNRQLSALASAEDKILALGYQIIGISPDNYKNLKPTLMEDKIKYQIFADKNAELIQKIGIGFTTPSGAKSYIKRKTDFEATEILPVPTVLVVNTSGEILFEYINPNYKKRLSEDLLLAVLKSLQSEL